MKHLALTFILLLSSAAGAKGRGYIIGNGGEGVWWDGKLHLADLAVHGLMGRNLLSRRPAEAKIKAWLDHVQLPAGAPREALAQKLSQLDRRLPGLAHLLVLAMGKYKWTLTDEELGHPYTDLDGPTRDFLGQGYVQLANRHRHGIRISARYWPELDVQNRVALILHETFSSLLWIGPGALLDEGDYVVQSSQKLYRLVAAAMYPKDAHLEALVRVHLNLELNAEQWELLPRWDDEPAVSVSLKGQVNGEMVDESLQIQLRDGDWQKFATQLFAICDRNFYDPSPGARPLNLTLIFEKPFMFLTTVRYTALAGEQVGLQLRGVGQGNGQSRLIGDFYQCQGTLVDFLWSVRSGVIGKPGHPVDSDSTYDVF